MGEWINRTRFVEFTSSNGDSVSVNPAGVAAFGAFTHAGKGTWISLIGARDDITVKNPYEDVRKANEMYKSEITLRDHFAGRAMQATLMNRDQGYMLTDQAVAQIAHFSYHIADAMLKAREGK